MRYFNFKRWPNEDTFSLMRQLNAGKIRCIHGSEAVLMDAAMQISEQGGQCIFPGDRCSDCPDDKACNHDFPQGMDAFQSQRIARTALSVAERARQ